MNKNLPLLFTIFTISGNYLIPKINDTSVGFTPSGDKLYAQPAGWTFSIWALIYSGLCYLTFKIYNNELQWNNSSILLYIFSCILNLLWIFFWTKKKPNTSQYILIGIVLSLTLLWYKNTGVNIQIYQNILSVYIAWTLGASLLNIFIAKNGDNMSNSINTSSSTNIIYLISLIQILWQIIQKNQNNIDGSLFFPITGIWTGLGIATNKTTELGLLKYLPLIVSAGCFYNQYNNLTNKNLKKLLF